MSSWRTQCRTISLMRLLQNKDGKLRPATFDAVSAAAAGMSEQHAGGFPRDDHRCPWKRFVSDLRIHLAADLQNMKENPKPRKLAKFLKWAMTDGQSYAKDLYYAPLPEAVAKLCLKKIDTITTN